MSKTLCDWLIIKGTGYTQCYNMVKPGAAVLEGFLRFPETTQGFPSMMGAPFFSYKVSRGIHSGLNSGVTGFCFDLKLRKCSEDLFFFFFGCHEGKLETFTKICVAASLETLRKDPTVLALQKSATNKLFGNYSAKFLEPPLG